MQVLLIDENAKEVTLPEAAADAHALLTRIAVARGWSHVPYPASELFAKTVGRVSWVVSPPWTEAQADHAVAQLSQSLAYAAWGVPEATDRARTPQQGEMVPGVALRPLGSPALGREVALTLEEAKQVLALVDKLFEDLDEAHRLLHAPHGETIENVFTWGEDDSLGKPLMSAMFKLFQAAGRPVPEKLILQAATAAHEEAAWR